MAEIRVSQLPVLTEYGGTATVRASQTPTLVELDQVMIRTSQVPVLAEIAEVAIYASQVPFLVEIEQPIKREGSSGPKHRTVRTHDVIAEPQVGYVLNPERSYFAVVLPEDGINLVSNPECVDLFSYSGQSCTVTLTTQEQRRGLKALACEAAAGGYVVCALAGPLGTGYHYTFSVDLKGSGRYALALGDANGTPVTAYRSITGTPFWHRHTMTEYVERSDIASLIVISLDAATFYLDGWQCERKAWATTFISGNLSVQADTAQPGAMTYGWLGIPHRSASFRTRFALSGGRPVPLSELGLEVTGFVGFGYAVPELITTRLARKGSIFGSASVIERQFSINGIVRGGGLLDVVTKRGRIGVLGEPTPLLLQVQFFDGDDPISEVAEIECVYAGGLEGNITGLYQERVTINFRAWRTNLRLLGNRATALSTTAIDGDFTAASVAYPDGTFDRLVEMDTWDDDDLPYRIAIKYGVPYMPRAHQLMRYIGDDWVAVVTLATDMRITDVVVGADGRLYYIYHSSVGDDVGGLACYDPVIGAVDDLGGVVFSCPDDVPMIMSRLHVDTYRNRLYVCGNFTDLTVGGVIQAGTYGNFDCVCYLDMRTMAWGDFHSLYGDDEEHPAVVYDVATGARGAPWIVGAFKAVNSETRFEGGTAWGIAYHDGTAWRAGMYPTGVATGIFLSGNDDDTGVRGGVGVLSNAGSSVTVDCSADLTYYIGDGLIAADHTVAFTAVGEYRKVVSVSAFSIELDEAIDLSPGGYGPQAATAWTFTRNANEIASVTASKATVITYSERRDVMYVGGSFQAVGHHDSAGRKILSPTTFGIAAVDAFFHFHGRIAGGLYNIGTIYGPVVNDLLYVPASDQLYVAGGFDRCARTDYVATEGTGALQSAPGNIIYDPVRDVWVSTGLTAPEYSTDDWDGYLAWAGAWGIADRFVASNAYSPIDLPDAAQWYGGVEFDFAVANAEAMYLTHAPADTVEATPVTGIVIPSGATVVARIEIVGPCHIDRIINATTRKEFAPGLDVAAGEVVIMQLDTSDPWVRSSTRGALAYPNLGRDSYPDLGLITGDNQIVLDADAGVGASVIVYWTEEYSAIDALVERYVF